MIVIRRAAERDIPAIIEFEIEIAKVSFKSRAVVDPAVHRQRLIRALERDQDTAFVAVDENDLAIGWLWMAANTNFVTQERYGNLRSLAVHHRAEGTGIADALLAHAIRRAREMNLPELTGKVHTSNLRMRTLYREHAFEPTFLTMRKELNATS
jgi:ribosomal protein S18 acetylase RimI-like enzyme